MTTVAIIFRQGSRGEDMTSPVESGGAQVVIDELLEEQARRWRDHKPTPVEGYLERHPPLRDDPDSVLALIFNEVALREELGESPRSVEYVRRFPALAREVADQFEVHRALRAGPRLPEDGKQYGHGQNKAAPPAPKDARAPWPQVPGYEILGLLGSGGMGVVYRALDKNRGALVALKAIAQENPGAILRFKQEFRSLVEVVHTNLVRLYELVFHDSAWYIVMELVEGADFLAYVRGDQGTAVEKSRGIGLTTTEAHDSLLRTAPGPDASGPAQEPKPLSPAGRGRLRDALLQLARGIAAVHSAGKLHRDIKPSNVLVTPQRRVVLLDFGLVAELGRQGLSQAADLHAPGTAAYMSPEQAAGTKVSAASDWYSMGVMLYEAVTGRLPIVGNALEVMMDKQRFDPPPPRELVSDLPEDLAALCIDLLRRDASTRPTGRDILRRLGDTPDPDQGSEQQSSRGQVPLVGRERHRCALHDAFVAVTGGRTVVLQVHGRSGAGKSILVQRYLDDLIEGDLAVVLAGRCYQQESVPYKALDAAVDMLARYLMGLPPEEARALMPRDFGALARVFPTMRRVEAIAEAPRRAVDVPDPQELRRRAFAALRELLARVGDHRPLLVSIDDAQWGDLDSAKLLADVLRPPDPPVLLLVATYRSEDKETSPFVRALGAPKGGPDEIVEKRELLVEPLTPAESRELALALFGRAGPEALERAEDVARESGGNPFFVGELVRHVQTGEDCSGGPGAAAGVDLDDVLWARIQRLPDEARRLLEVVAISGRPLREADACHCVEGLVDGRSALALLQSSRLVRGVPGTEEEIETYHDRVRETVVARLGPEALQGHHRRLALVLEASGRADPELLGAHFCGAGDAEKGGQYFAAAAVRAADALAFDRAAKLYRRALEVPPAEIGAVRRLRTALGDALANAGRGAEAAVAYLEAAQGATTAEALELRRRTALQYLISGHIDEGLAALRSVLGEVGMRLPATPRGALLSLLWQRARLRLRGLDYRRRDPSEISAADLTRVDVCWSAATGLSVVDTIRGADFQSRCTLLALRAGERSRIARSLAMEAAHSATGGLRCRARTARLLAAADHLAGQVEDPYPRGTLAVTHGIAFYLEGDWKQAHAHCTQAVDFLRERCTGVYWERNTATAFGLWALSHMGEVAELGRQWSRLLAEARDRGDLYAVMNLSTYLLSIVRLAADEPDRARDEVGQAMAHWSRGGYHVQHNDQAWGMAQIHLYAGRGGAAWDLMTWNWPALSRSLLLRVQFIRVAMWQLRARCALAAAEDSSEPEALLHAAAADARRLEREATPWSHASARLVRAALAWNHGDERGAADLLTDAAGRFDGIPMAICAAAARRRLGVLVGGDQGAALVESADAWMRGQEVRDPIRTTEVYAPGFNKTRASAG
jgi:serine/threonine protein kinase/tetratricopeptide (TPR) repeat protein